MSTSNGVAEDKRSSSADTGVEDKRVAVENHQNTSLEDGFRGFQKVPLVLVSRHDITPYLQTCKVPLIGGKPHMKPVNGIGKHYRRLSQQCAINLVRQDLEQLRRDFLAKRIPGSPTGSSSDIDKDIMSNIKCKICEKSYSSEKKLLKHQENKHMIVKIKPQKRVSFSDHVIIHEVTQYHKCRKCSKIFEAYQHLKTHMKQHHRKRKCYICNYCNKNFVDRTFFKVHIKLHCDVCGMLFQNKVTYNEHRRNVCRILKHYKCKTCDEIYFSFMDLKDHSYEHNSMQYVCDVCKDHFESKCAIAHHISFLHSNNRPTALYDMLNLGNERLYLCKFCDESSVERDILERHVQLLPDLTNKAMTGYKDYYFCDQCFEKFDTEKGMLQHKWSHFLKTSDNSQEREQPKKKIMKMTYKIGEPIPEYMQPTIVLEKVEVPEKILEDSTLSKNLEFVDVSNININTGILKKALTGPNSKKAIIDPKSKKTIISKYQCQNCGKYYCSNYNLTRHIETQHSNYDSLQCKVCEETFVWPSLLQSHKCIRLKHPEMPFEDARPEIHFDNLHEITPNGFDDLNIEEDDDYMNTVDFEIPAPIVELTEYDVNPGNQDKFAPLQNLGYKLVMQEVPIEF